MAERDDISPLSIKARIREVMAQYVRGVDHRDAAVLKSCYHADAYEMHHIFNGNAHEFAEWRARQTFRSHHMLSESATAIDGSRALVETPHTAVVHVDLEDQERSGVIEIATSGWYLDLFTERDGAWKISFQRVVSFSSSTRLIPRPAAAVPAPGPGEDGLAKRPDPFQLGFGLAEDRPVPGRIEDVAASIRAAYLAGIRSPGEVSN